MSTLNVDTINDSAGTGAPDFPNGITLNSGQSLTAYLEDESAIVSGDLTNDNGSGSISGISVACGRSLKVGRIVHVWLQADFTMDTAAGKLRVTLPYSSDSSPRQIFFAPCRANNAGAGHDVGLLTFDSDTSTSYIVIGPDISSASATFSTGANSVVSIYFCYTAAS